MIYNQKKKRKEESEQKSLARFCYFYTDDEKKKTRKKITRQAPGTTQPAKKKPDPITQKSVTLKKFEAMSTVDKVQLFHADPDAYKRLKTASCGGKCNDG